MDARKARGQQTKEKILNSAAHLFHVNGVNGTSVDDVLKDSNTGKSQFYHYFGSKDKLVREVLRHHMDRFEEMRNSLNHVQSFVDFEHWFSVSQKEVLEDKEYYGCPIGMMANELSLSDEDIRVELDRSFILWQDLFARCFAVLKAKGEFNESFDPDEMAEFFVAGFQGACLVAKTRSDRTVLQRTMGSCMKLLSSFKTK